MDRRARRGGADRSARVVIATPHYYALTDAREFDNDAVTLVRMAGSRARSLTLAAARPRSGRRCSRSRWRRPTSSSGRARRRTLGGRARPGGGARGDRRGADLPDRDAAVWAAPAVVAGAIAAVYPPLVLAGSSLLSESLFIPLVLGALLAALVHRDSEHRWRWLVLSGARRARGADPGQRDLPRAPVAVPRVDEAAAPFGLALRAPLACSPRRSWSSSRGRSATTASSIGSSRSRPRPATCSPGPITRRSSTAAIPGPVDLPVAQMQRLFVPTRAPMRRRSPRG